MPGKNKVSDMSVEELMQHGLDSDEEEVTEKVVVKKAKKKTKVAPKKTKLVAQEKKDACQKTKESSQKIKQKRSEVSSHKKHLESLKDKDPEFYKFLQENDSELLEFNDSDNEENDDDDDGGEKITSSTGSKDLEDGMADDESMDESNFDSDDDAGADQEDDDADEEKSKPRKTVTHELIATWKAGLENDDIKILKTVMSAFSSAVEALSPDEVGKEDQEKKSSQQKIKYDVDGGSMFNSLVTLCLKYSFKILEKYLEYASGKNKKKKALPSSSKNWGNVKSSVKQYLFDILQLLRQLAEPTVLTIVLRHCQSLNPYFATFPKLSKMLLKRLVRMWSTADEHVRVLAFLGLRKLTILVPNLFEYTLKKLYLAFVRNSKFVTLKSKPILQFMENSLVEMYSMDIYLTYQQAFVYIRQLAIHLRNAITTKKKDSYQAVYNWQYISCLQLWCTVISELYGDVLKPLVYPLVQITLGVIRLIPSTRYYPLRFICIKLLNTMSEKANVYIPTATYILEAIESKEFQRKPSSSEKPPDFAVVLKLTKPQLLAKGCQDTIIDLAFETMLNHYVIYSNSIAFPELTFPICHRLKKLTKATKVSKLSKDMKTLIEKIQSHGDNVTKDRSLVTFSPKDIDQVRDWECNKKELNNPLKEFQKIWLNMKSRAAEDEDSDDDTEVGKKRKVNHKTPTDGSSKKVKLTEKKVKKPFKARKHNEKEDDILEDYQFSDED